MKFGIWGLFGIWSLGFGVCNCTVGIDENLSNYAAIKVFPNPFNDYTTFLLEGINSYDGCSFALYDIFGREVKSIENISNNPFHINKDNLNEDIYIYKIFSNSKIISTGKLVLSQ